MNLLYRIEKMKIKYGGKIINRNVSDVTNYRQYPETYAADRILHELDYLVRLAEYQKREDVLLQVQNAFDALEENVRSEGSVTRSMVAVTEKQLAHLSDWARSIEVLCAGHAHIDMNWQWGWHETVQLTLDTFRTVLDLMDCYPQFKFSQSQASCYKIVADYNQPMLQKIKERIHEGRWEISGATWVEGDNNMTNLESEFRHVLYTKKYLAGLFDIEPESLQLDYEPDTFGHNANIPETLAKCGVKYFYFCRGYDNLQQAIFRWQAASGGEVLAYVEPKWYMQIPSGKMLEVIPEFCSRHNVDKYLAVYGVGDHGGGPTRRDIERLMDMQGWPLAPKITFSTYNEYFRYLDGIRGQFPAVTGEMNYFSDGCYTSQSRIKLANRFGEAALYESELYSAVCSSMYDVQYPAGKFADAWQRVLFSHFHDILPGSGVTATREYAMGAFQETMAIANSCKQNALRVIADDIDTSALWGRNDDEGTDEFWSEGAGAGVGSDGQEWRMSKTERCCGCTRIYHVFNQLPFERDEVIAFMVWDWHHDKSNIICYDSAGHELECQTLSINRDTSGRIAEPARDGRRSDWGHEYFQLLVRVKIPPCGYTTIILTEKKEKQPGLLSGGGNESRCLQRQPLVLENEMLRAVFDERGVLESLFDKKSGLELIDCGRGGGMFRICEEKGGGMSAWRVWELQKIAGCSPVRVNSRVTGENNLRQYIEFEAKAAASRVIYLVSLDKKSDYLEFSVKVEWREFGEAGVKIPQLQYYLPLAYRSDKEKYVCDIAGNIIEREPHLHDVPCLSFMAAGGVQLVTDSKYGYRGAENSITATLIRSSFDPDDYPEIGWHSIRFALRAVNAGNSVRLVEGAERFCKLPDVVSAYRAGAGQLPPEKSFISICGPAVLSAVKQSEDGAGIVVRLYSLANAPETVCLKLPFCPAEIKEIDGNEEGAQFGAMVELQGDGARLLLQAHAAHSFLIRR